MTSLHRGGRLLAVVALVLAFASVLACADKVPTAPGGPIGNRPEIIVFEAASSRVVVGQSTFVRWEVADKNSEIRIDGSSTSIGNGLPDSGQFTFTATAVGTFTFTLIATNTFGTSSRFVTITVAAF